MAQQPGWREHRLSVADHELAWYQAGAGPEVVLLHGCYDSLLYRPLAELFAPRHRCILYDQRGGGASTLQPRDAESLRVEKFLDDLERLRRHLGLEKLRLIGHSWGATLGLLYAGRFPQRVDRLVLIGMGPVSAEMRAVYKANVLRMMRPEDRPRWPEVNGRYSAARRRGHVRPEVDEANIRMWSPVMFYSSEHAERFVAEYLRAGGWRRHVPSATGFHREDALAEAHRITAPVLVVYGYQDYEPITQAYLLAERIRQARLLLLNECGHMAWWDQPKLLAAEVEGFLSE